MTSQLADAPTKSHATVARIIAAARGLFVARAYADVTTDMIARSAEVTKGGLYHHFASKEQLYVTMMLDDLNFKELLFAEAVALPGTCRQRLAALTRDFLNLPHQERQLTRLVRRDINSFTDPERDQLVRAYQRALPDQVQAIIAHGISSGELSAGDARILSWSFVALVEVVTSDYAEHIFESTEACLDHVLNLFFSGAAAQPT